MFRIFNAERLVHSGAQTTIIKNDEQPSSAATCVKITNSEFPSKEVLSYLENELTLSAVGCTSVRNALQLTTVENHPALSLEYIAGSSLREYMEPASASITDKISVSLNICNALVDLHRHKILHNNICPEHIILNEQSGNAVFIDLGIAHVLEKKAGRHFDIHLAEKMSPYYISPENTGRINRNIDLRSDIYCTGLVLYELFTGEKPFELKDKSELIYAHIAKKPVPPALIRTKIPLIISDIIMKMLEKNPEDRYQSASGVLYDLEEYHTRQAEGNETNFPLGSRDFSSRFILPSKIYGKERERETLLEKFETCANGAKDFLLLSGVPGAGKSTLVAGIQKSVIAANGFFVTGKFDQLQHSGPYSGFIQAFREVIDLILTKNDQTKTEWRHRILQYAGESGRVLTDLIPDMENLIGSQPQLPELSAVELQNRFNYILAGFIKAIAYEGHPLVLFIDDIQWADTSSAYLFDLIFNDKDIRYLLVICAYRNNEIDEANSVKQLLARLEDENAPCTEIEMSPLTLAHTEELVKDLFRTGQDDNAAFAQLVYDKTKGNPFYTRRFLQSVYDEGFLFFDDESCKWQWNKADIEQMNVSGNVADLMILALKKYPATTLRILQIASCIGNRFDLNLAATVLATGTLSLQEQLRGPLADEIIIDIGGVFMFAHDRIQQTVNSLIPENERQEIHLRIGKALSDQSNESKSVADIFTITNQWNAGIDLVIDEQDKLLAAGLNTEAGKKAKSSAAYNQALGYFDTAITLLGNNWTQQYDRLLQTYEQAAESAFLAAEMERANELVQIIETNARTPIEALKAYEVKIQKLIAGHEYKEAVEFAISILSRFDVRIPLHPHKLAVVMRLLFTTFITGRKSPAFFEKLPQMTDRNKLAAVRLLSVVTSAIVLTYPDLLPLVVFKNIELSMKYGLSPKSPFSFMGIGYIMSVYMQQIEKGIAYGKIALSLSRKLRTKELDASLLMTYYVYLAHWTMPLADTIPELEKAFITGAETGDFEFTSYLAHNITYHSFFAGLPLDKLADRSEELNNQIEKYKQEFTITRLKVFRQAIAQFIVKTPQPHILAGEILDENLIRLPESEQNFGYFQNLYLVKTVLALYFNKSEEAFDYAVKCEKYQEVVKGSVVYLGFYYYEALAITAGIAGKEETEQKRLQKKLHKNLSLIRQYERYCPQNYAHRRLLIEAEIARLEDRKEDARLLYDKSIRQAVENKMLHDEALAWELAGKFHIQTAIEQIGVFYINNALLAYRRWGASAKIEDLAARYSHLDIRLPEEPGQTAIARDTDIDLGTLLKASTALSGELVLSSLLEQLMHLLAENAGAQSGFIMVEKAGHLNVEAELVPATGQISTLQSRSLDEIKTAPLSVINYVIAKRETVLLDNAAESALFRDDPFIVNHAPKSILCMPLIRQGKLQGVIYLANEITIGAFTESRVSFLKLLSTQIAISLENALFYSDMEHRVSERTHELNLEKQKSENLLLNILPGEIAKELKETGEARARRFDNVSILFTDFKDFTKKSELLTPEELVSILDIYFRHFDSIISKYGIEKIKTIGDAYLCVGGMLYSDAESALNIVKAALEILVFVEQLQQAREAAGLVSFSIRMGIHVGPVVAGIVGEKKFAYDIWGDAVNTAARMEQASEPGRLNISHDTWLLVKDHVICTHRGKIEAKNKGMIDMYFVDGLKENDTQQWTVASDEIALLKSPVR
ncbi:adenylate/guanylate cyclase domain-containing protein [Taibaiella soli]|uniref:Guanylate cyclase n=1 Tax=Taibaiella soli TaxID=1649169 RepID=A0A2W2AB42_9BACT|nr:adenylate/guanylate cyclase domain-containing protein [Taibaiella soli]PZF72625.1 hypothetical protein DN068_12225 [Taibaiella soli]